MITVSKAFVSYFVIQTAYSVVIATLLLAAAAQAQSPKPIDVGGRLELFVDDYLIDHTDGEMALHLHKPSGKEVSLESNSPWEDPTMGYFAVFRDGDTFRMFYRVASRSRSQNYGNEFVSLSARVPAARHTAMFTSSETTRTEPSSMATFTWPG